MNATENVWHLPWPESYLFKATRPKRSSSFYWIAGNIQHGVISVVSFCDIMECLWWVGILLSKVSFTGSFSFDDKLWMEKSWKILKRKSFCCATSHACEQANNSTHFDLAAGNASHSSHSRTACKFQWSLVWLCLWNYFFRSSIKRTENCSKNCLCLRFKKFAHSFLFPFRLFYIST